MKANALRLFRHQRRARLASCLWAVMIVWAVAPQAAPGQDAAAQTQSPAQAANLAEAKRLSDQSIELFEQGKYAEAIPLVQRALALREKALGPKHPDVAEMLSDLGLMYKLSGDYARAELLYQRALAIYEQVQPPHPLAANTLDNLALLYDAKGDYARSEPLHQRALAIYEQTYGPEHTEVAIALDNLAEFYKAKGDYARAEPLQARAVAIYEKLKPGHPGTANALDNLAEVYEVKGDYARSESLHLRALDIYKKALGPEHPDFAIALANLARLYKLKGDYAQAEPLYQNSLDIIKKTLGTEHPHAGTALNYLTELYEAKGDYASALQFSAQALEVRETNLALILATGSERQKLAYLATLSGETNTTISLHTRLTPADPQALRLALTTVLRRKGRALDAMSDQIASLRRRLDPKDRALLDQLYATQAQLAALTLGGPGKTPPAEHRAAQARLEAQVEQLQDAVARRSAEFRVRTQPVTLEQVRGALPAGSTLVEFFSYRPFDPKAKTWAARFGPARYVAYVLGGRGEPLWTDLGEATAVDAEMARLLAALKCPQAATGLEQCPSVAVVKQLARAVDERVMRPVRKLLGDTRQVFISPDGALNLLPFAALVDESGKYLVETYSLTYLTSGRDLLRLQLSTKSRRPPLVIADPLFGRAQAASNAPARGAGDVSGLRSAEMGRMYFAQLPGTAQEARALGATLPGVQVRTQAEATEAALKQVSAPRVLHVATHGFFLPDQSRAAGGTQGIRPGGDASTAGSVENPLLRSGLALEGANSRQGAGGEDGILTALEAAGLDLWGTKLVVLSACETGVGEVKNGEGVYGLRRALVLAGSESQVMSLWQVSDEATRDLMTRYYKRLMAGEGRTEALRQVQLAMLRGGKRAQGGGLAAGLGVRGPDFSHPFYWAAFIQSGDWRPMSEQ
jgi:CHAT domain-containing protein/tetratricopeptide (TPR) repeat protein